MNTILQLTVIILGAVTVYLMAHTDPNMQRGGCLIGLIAQPFWLYSALVGGQWGIGVLVIWYAFSYFKGYKARK